MPHRSLHNRIVLALSLGVGVGTFGQTALHLPRINDPVNMKRIAEKLMSDNMSGAFMPSIEAKEAADFLITPAILVQECLQSHTTVITYPTQ